MFAEENGAHASEMLKDLCRCEKIALGQIVLHFDNGSPMKGSTMLATMITLGVINEMASEYRALRASILRLWADRCDPKSTDMQDMICFNEAIDQALCESIGHFSGEVDRARNLLLGVLGHDMRTLL